MHFFQVTDGHKSAKTYGLFEREKLTKNAIKINKY